MAALVYAIGVLLYGAGVFLGGSAMLAETEILRRYFSEQRQITQERPQLGADAEALFRQYQRWMDLQNQADDLLRYEGS